MTLRISAKTKKSLQDELGIDKANVEDHVWNHKPQKCFLCGATLNRSSDEIELDHNTPVNEGGTDEFSNLNLTHVECNRYKRNNSSFDVRPHLRFKRFWEENWGKVNFKDVKRFYKVKDSDVFLKLSSDGSKLRVESASGKVDALVHSENVMGKNQRFCFVTLPVSCIHNDDEIQPRQIKLNHLLNIASDLKKNPLHEQPACRIEGGILSGPDKKTMLMFDGQHKTVAHLINENQEITFKIYLDISKDEAVVLINSIQSRIKKLPLTPFELATKMSDEVRRKLEIYESIVGSSDVSEQGFVQWLDPADRTRAKAGIAAAVIDRVITDDSLAFAKVIESKGSKDVVPYTIKEPSFQKNVLKELLATTPLDSAYKGEDMKAARSRETENVVKLLNMLYDKGFRQRDDEAPDVEVDRIKRLTYQASLKVMCTIIKQVARKEIMPTDDHYIFLEKDIKHEQWDKIALAADKFFDHPVWKADLTSGENVRAVDDALKKNQNIENAFKKVGLTAAYCADLESLPTHWA